MTGAEGDVGKADAFGGEPDRLEHDAPRADRIVDRNAELEHAGERGPFAIITAQKALGLYTELGEVRARELSAGAGGVAGTAEVVGEEIVVDANLVGPVAFRHGSVFAIHGDVGELSLDLLVGEPRPGALDVGERQAGRLGILDDGDLVTLAADLDPSTARLAEFVESAAHAPDSTPAPGAFRGDLATRDRQLPTLPVTQLDRDRARSWWSGVRSGVQTESKVKNRAGCERA